MNIQFIQKLTLLDYPGYVACTVFLHGCNLRCPFCHNAGLVTRAPEGRIEESELYAFLESRKGLIDGVCISGGEPLISDDVFNILYKVKSLGYKVKIDTNGFFPARLRRAIDEGLCDYVAMDLKNSAEKYPETCGIQNLDISPVLESISILKEGKVDYEFRTTVSLPYHTPQDLVEASKLIAGAKKYFLQSFKDSGDIIKNGCKAMCEADLRAAADAISAYVPSVKLRGM